MIHYEELPLDQDIIDSLKEIEIDYVFQPIFRNKTKEIFAYEALMRPHGISVTELIAQYMAIGKLHVLEVITFFGATQEAMRRGYSEYISINSFPSEAFTPEEDAIFDTYYGQGDLHGIVEILEYPGVNINQWAMKSEVIRKKGLLLAVDDYGAGYNDKSSVSLFNPQIVKLDRAMISGIDHDINKQMEMKKLIKAFHMDNRMVLAEGVETEEEYNYLSRTEVDLLQGYYLGRPC